ncbi:MAG: hypothetical protein ACOC1H_01790 [Desulfosalsimonas sp.]
MARKKILTVALWLSIAVLPGALEAVFEAATAPEDLLHLTAVRAQTTPDTYEKEIEWFRDQMGISEKYMKDQDGVWGMSWGHFFTMVLLVLFALGALAKPRVFRDVAARHWL